MSQETPPSYRSYLRKGRYPTDVRPGIRGLRSKAGVAGLVLVLAPGALLVTVAVQSLGSGSHKGISDLNLGRGIASSCLMVFYGYLFLKTAITGEDYKGQRDEVARDEAQTQRDQLWREREKARKLALKRPRTSRKRRG